MDCIEREVRKNSKDVKGDWKPLVFILTDGAPSDEWETAASELKARKPANIIAVGSDDANTDVLRASADTVLMMKDSTPDSYAKFFKWVTASVSQSSQKAGAATASPSGGITLPPPPPQIMIVPE